MRKVWKNSEKENNVLTGKISKNDNGLLIRKYARR